MNPTIQKLIIRSGIGNIRVRSPRGLVEGSLWTLFPFSSYWRGTSDAGCIQWLDRFCKPGVSTLDLGAHFGLFTVAMANRVGHTGHVVALEPDAAARGKCLAHVAMNGLSWVRVFPEAASSSNGTVAFEELDGEGSSTGRVSGDPGSGVSMPCVRLDDLYSRYSLPDPEFIKIDVENHGAQALMGAPRILSACPHILMSFHSRDEMSGTRDCLKGFGYRVLSLSGEPLDWEQSVYHTVVLTTGSDRPAVPSQLQ